MIKPTETNHLILNNIETLDFTNKVFVLDKSLSLFKCGARWLSRKEYSELGMPRYEQYMEEYDPKHPIVRKIIDAGGVIKSNITGKTDYYVVDTSSGDYSAAKVRDYHKQLEKGKPIAAISLDNLKVLLGIDEREGADEQDDLRFADKYKMIELFDPDGTEVPVVKTDNIYVDEIDISGDACSDWKYTFAKNQATVYLTDYLGNSDSITLPTTIEGKKVEITWTWGCSFPSCKAKKVSVPGSYIEIPTTFFQGNLYLEEITLGAGIEEIGLNFCAGAENLEKVNFPDTIKNVGFNCLAETKWASEQGNESIIGTVLLKGPNISRESVYHVPEGIRCIAQWAFSVTEGGSYHIHRVELPASMKYISEQAFSTSKLTSLRVPSTLVYIGARAFLGTDLEHLYREKKREHMLIIGNILCAIYAENCGSELHIPEGVEIVSDESMQYLLGGSTMLNHVILPDSMKELGRRIGRHIIWEVKQISINNGLKKIGSECFYGFTGLEEIDLPYGLEELGDHAFARSGLKHVTIPGNIETIKESTFYNCEKLETVTVCEGIKSVEDSVFEGCKSLCSIKLPSTLKRIGYRAFANCVSLKTITIPPSVDIDHEAFAECGEIEILNE